MDKQQILKEREEWYSNTFILFEIVKCLKNRELCYLTQKGEEKKKAVRYLLGFSVDYFKKHNAWINLNDTLLNIYHSVALLKPEVPVFSYNLKERSNDPKYKDFNENYGNYVQKYNLLIDIDGKEDFDMAWKEAIAIKKLFDDYKLPYYIVNSSFKGFHIVIPSKYMPEISIRNLLGVLNEAMYNLVGIYGFKAVDTSIIDLKRVQKCPYTYACDGAIVLPLTDYQLQNFRPDIVTMKNVLKFVTLKNRGLLMRTHNLDEKQLKENVQQFITEFK